MVALWCSLVSHIGRLRRNRAGQDMVEYALLAGFIAVAVAVVFPASILPSLTNIWSNVGSVLANTPG